MIGRSVIYYGALCDRAGMPFLTHSVGPFLDGASGCALLEWPEQVRKCIAFKSYPDTTSD
jgi:hypothetical protein